MRNKSGGGTQTSTQQTVQSNEPPAWARPLFERGAQDALRLYDQGIGFNPYTGPTQAPMSDVTLGGLNSLLAATGYQGDPVTNEMVAAMVPEVTMPERSAAPLAAPQPEQEMQGFRPVTANHGPLRPGELEAMMAMTPADFASPDQVRQILGLGVTEPGQLKAWWGSTYPRGGILGGGV